MATELPLVFFHSPSTRSTGVLMLLEELKDAALAAPQA